MDHFMANIQHPIDYFPLAIATGDAFCNRVEEIKKLQTCIQHKRPVLLVSPRRYGKTSLALRAINKSKLPYAHIDFFSSVDEEDIEKAILKGVGRLISRMESLPKKALSLASEIFEGTQIRVVFNKMGISIETHKEREKPADRVLDVLERIEKLAQKTDKQIILFFDEFQCVREIATNHAMEGVLRQVAQLTKSISFVFSGSNRHLLNELFEDRNRPFYKLCERITLGRIDEEAYTKNIQAVAKLQWGKELSQRELEAIYYYSERHPYYLNLLCSRLLMCDDPTVDVIENVWAQYVLEERSHVASETELLSKNQRKLLTILARSNGSVAPLGKEFVHQANMSKTSIEQALNFLVKTDYVYKDETGRARVLDPLIKTALAS